MGNAESEVGAVEAVKAVFVGEQERTLLGGDADGSLTRKICNFVFGPVPLTHHTATYCKVWVLRLARVGDAVAGAFLAGNGGDLLHRNGWREKARTCCFEGGEDVVLMRERRQDERSFCWGEGKKRGFLF